MASRRPRGGALDSRRLRAGLAAAACVFGVAACAARPRPLQESNGDGFAIYRSGQLDADRLAELCRRGVEEIVVMDGGAARRECRLRSRVCPGLRVRYDHAQDVRVPPSVEFLVAFDRWVEESRRAERRIAFRCRHGWHRAGRLTAYYRMRFDGWGAQRAIDEMLQSGRFMNRHPELKPQVRAMADGLAGRPCSVEERFCPQPGRPADEGLVGVGEEVRFAADTCPEVGQEVAER